MNNRLLTSLVVLVLVSSAPALGALRQDQAPVNWVTPRTAWGAPDLEGIWNNGTLTPLERSEDLREKEFFTEEEAAEFERQTLELVNADNRGDTPEEDIRPAYNEFWRDRGTNVVTTRRTSMIIDPADGRIPALTPAGARRQAERQEYRRLHPADGPEDRPLPERCLVWRSAGPPMLPTGYNSNYQILQTPGQVIILIEMIHDVRIIPLDGRPHLPGTIRQWHGDPRGYWEGDTLVVETTNFNDKNPFNGSGPNMHLTERFTRVDPDTILYEFTVNEPETFTRPWTAQYSMVKAEGPIFEYACHEGNYALGNVLAGYRAEERAPEEEEDVNR